MKIDAEQFDLVADACAIVTPAILRRSGTPAFSPGQDDQSRLRFHPGLVVHPTLLLLFVRAKPDRFLPPWRAAKQKFSGPGLAAIV